MSKAMRSTATTAPKCGKKCWRRRNRATGISAISAPRPICSRSSKKLFRDYGESGTGTTRHYVHDNEEAALYGGDPGTFTAWSPLPAESDLLFVRGLHGAVVTDKVDISGNTPISRSAWSRVINLEWIQKLHRDRKDRGYSTEAVTDTILRRMPDYVNNICPQFTETDINFSACPRWTPRIRSSRGGSRRRMPIDGRDPIAQSARHRFSLSAVDDPNSFMSRANSIVIHGSKLDLAMQLILTPLILQLIERKRRTRMTALHRFQQPMPFVRPSLTPRWPMRGSFPRRRRRRRRSLVIWNADGQRRTLRRCCSRNS